jgi:Transcriptional activator of glycolytic enzymes
VKTIVEKVGSEVAKILGTSILWAAYESTSDVVLLPQWLMEKVKEEFENIVGTPNENPVERIGLCIGGSGDQLHIVDTQSESTSQSNPTSSGVTYQESVTQSQQLALHHLIEDFRHELRNSIGRIQSRLTVLEGNVKRIALQPIVRAQQNHEVPTGANTASGASLSKCPRDLYTLWKEYEFGIGGKKAAKEFTAVERGSCKSAYSRRKCFWDTVENLIRRGYTSDTACDRVYSIYGRSNSVTKILLLLRKDRRQGGHPHNYVKNKK